MKRIFLSFFLLCSQSSMFCQSHDPWIAFWNKDSTLIGFKDLKGEIRIPPRFEPGSIHAQVFNNIIAVAGEEQGKRQSYYLTKSGKKIGRDSLHFFDNGTDCESEGFIRFRDAKTDKVGMFNKKGDIAIPARYNELSSVRNGLIIALSGARKKIWEGGEHFSWVGGRTTLIDTTGKILVDHYDYPGNVNFYSLKISARPDPDMIRQSIKTVDGQYFSFIDFTKEFRAWLQSVLLENFSRDKLFSATFREVTYWKDSTGWISENKDIFIDRNYELIKTKLLALNNKDCTYDIFENGLNPYIYNSDLYSGFFNSCGESIDWINPVQEIVISYGDKTSIQDFFSFLRTNEGYKLISLTIRMGQIK